MSTSPDPTPLAARLLLDSQDMTHPFDFSSDEIEGLGIELFAIEPPQMLDGSVEALSTDCGNTLSTLLCDCVNTLSTLFCLSCSGCSG